MLPLLLAAAAAVATMPAPPALRTTWRAPSGEWSDVARWSAALPTPFNQAAVRGDSVLTLPSGTQRAGDLEIGLESGDHARVKVAGGQLILMRDSLRLGEHTGGSATCFLSAGAIHSAMDVFVGGASTVPDRATQAELHISGGNFLGRSLTLGAGMGAHALLSVDGSNPEAVALLDYLYVEAFTDPKGPAGQSTLAFTLDAHGVTPITIASRHDGLRIVTDAQGRADLRITLSAVPPREDIPLVIANVPPRGTFHDLPEGADIAADFDHQTYHFALTYRGGASHHDLVLLNKNHFPADAPLTHTRPAPAMPQPLWQQHPLFPDPLPIGTPAFAGAEGFGAYTPGGAGGRTIVVDNLQDDGPGSLRAALTAAGPRVIMPRIAGDIPLRSPIDITEPFVTFDAGAAPLPGITLRDHGLVVKTHDVVLRHFRIRIGDAGVVPHDPTHNYAAGDGETGLDFVDGADNCIADHLSVSWATNKLLSTTIMADRITVQWCILSEALNFADHGYASIAAGSRVTWHHNLFAHNESRNARFQGMVDADFRNNVVYDWGEAAAYGEFDRLNYVGNYLKPGPSTTQTPRLFHEGDHLVAAGSIYVADNVLEGDPRATADNWRGMGYYYFDRATLAAKTPFAAPPVATQPPEEAYQRVLAEAGDTLPARDAVDQRIVREVQTGAGRIINHLSDLPGGGADR